MEKSKIQWTEHTGGPWLGCSMVSAGCTNCYAMELAESRLKEVFRKAYLNAGGDWVDRPVWGDKAVRVLTKGFWGEARRINAKHAKAGTHGRWFPSMIDWLDEMPAGIVDQGGQKLNPVAVLADFLRLVMATPNLTWLLLTKRPENFHRLLEKAQDWDFDHGERLLCGFLRDWRQGTEIPHNVWIGASVENHEQTKRIDHLINIPAAMRFLSVEPMLEKIDLKLESLQPLKNNRIHWAIFGGESGPKARPCNIDWIRDGLRQCRAAGVAPFIKQLGGFIIGSGITESGQHWPAANELGAAILMKEVSGLSAPWRYHVNDNKGGDMSEWPNDLRVREYPEASE